MRCAYRQGSLSRPIFRLGDRSDSATFSTNTFLGSYLMGGPGNDTLAGGRGNDVFAGGAGDDVMSGAGGSDVFDEDNAANGSDEMHRWTRARTTGCFPAETGSTTARAGIRSVQISVATVTMASAASGTGSERTSRFSAAVGGTIT